MGTRVVEYDRFSTAILPNYKPLEKTRNIQGQKRRYLDCVCSFDIETTNIREIKLAVMFVWQFAFETDVAVIGRTWDQYLSFLQDLREWLPPKTWLCVYVHNLSFEFQYLSGVYQFWFDEVFALEARSILRCDMFDVFEYRCSMKLCNDSLDIWTKSLGVEHQKKSGEDFDYSKRRWSWTPLTAKEYGYCINDVLGVVDCIHATMAFEGDDLATIPMTQTGFIRRELKHSMSKLGHWYLKDLRPTYEQYKMLRAAFRGGNTHANRYIAGETVEDVHTVDRSSSYPDVLCNCKFPIGKFIKPLNHVDPPDLMAKGYAVLFSFHAYDVVLKEPYWGFPYLSTDKCEYTAGKDEDGNRLSIIDNGRIIMAREVRTTVTDVDFRIIMQEYEFKGGVRYSDIWFAKYGFLPEEFTSIVKRHYKDKTALKGTPKVREYLHAKEKNNSCYGICAQNPMKDEVLYLDEDLFRDVSEDADLLGYKKLTDMTDRQLSKYRGRRDLPKKYREAFKAEKDLREKIIYDNTPSFLPYQWGVWCTAHARYELEIAMWACMENGICRLLYIDTDSLYYEGPEIDFAWYNNERQKRSEKNDAYGIDAKGRPHYMGVLESDPPIDRFRTWGAKKYIYERSDRKKVTATSIVLRGYRRWTFHKYRKLTVTIAGVNKKIGSKELLMAAAQDTDDPFETFDRGFTFYEAGGTEAWYNDEPYGVWVEPESGNTINITRNVYLQDGEYTLSTTPDYWDILEHFRINPDFAEQVLDNWYKSEYNKING